MFEPEPGGEKGLGGARGLSERGRFLLADLRC